MYSQSKNYCILLGHVAIQALTPLISQTTFNPLLIKHFHKENFITVQASHDYFKCIYHSRQMLVNSFKILKQSLTEVLLERGCWMCFGSTSHQNPSVTQALGPLEAHSVLPSLEHHA